MTDDATMPTAEELAELNVMIANDGMAAPAVVHRLIVAIDKLTKELAAVTAERDRLAARGPGGPGDDAEPGVGEEYRRQADAANAARTDVQRLHDLGTQGG